MSAVALEPAGMDRRTILRAGALTFGVVAAARVTPSLGPALLETVRGGGAALPAMATWEAVVGRHLIVTPAGDAAQLVELLDVSPAPASALLGAGEAYSLLFDGRALPAGSSHVVSVRGEGLRETSLVIMPVNGNGSWQAVIDRRRPVAGSK